MRRDEEKEEEEEEQGGMRMKRRRLDDSLWRFVAKHGRGQGDGRIFRGRVRVAPGRQPQRPS